jgi:PTS system nitrogen regulatory IIA component
MQLTVKDISILLGISERTVYRYIKAGTIPSYKIQDQYRFNRAEILEWATSRKMHLGPEIFLEPESSKTPLPLLSEVLRSGGIHYRLEGDNKTAILRNMTNMMHLPPEVNRDFLFRVLMAREALSSTGVGDGIAIPHVRNPVVLNIPQPLTALYFLDKPVDFDAIDNKPVFCLFTIVSPTVRAHLHLLSKLAFALKSESFKSILTSQASREEIFRELTKIEEELVTAIDK